jgi:ribosomal protein S21
VSEVKRKKNESFDAFFRRVKQQWMRSGRVLQVRKVQFFEKKKSKNVQKNQAVSHSKMVSKNTYLRKIGKLPEIDESKKKRGKRRRR